MVSQKRVALAKIMLFLQPSVQKKCYWNCCFQTGVTNLRQLWPVFENTELCSICWPQTVLGKARDLYKLSQRSSGKLRVSKHPEATWKQLVMRALWIHPLTLSITWKAIQIQRDWNLKHRWVTPQLVTSFLSFDCLFFSPFLLNTDWHLLAQAACDLVPLWPLFMPRLPRF